MVYPNIYQSDLRWWSAHLFIFSCHFVIEMLDLDVNTLTPGSNVSGSMSGHALLERMDHLILVVENLAEAQWYMASACAASRMAVGTLVDKCNFLGFKGVGLGEEDKEEDVQIIHKGALLCPVSETKIRGMLQNTDLVPSVRD